MAEGEIYPNPPVVLTALEVRHPAAGELSPGQQRELKERLRPALPILRNAQQITVQGAMALGPAASGAVAEKPTFQVENFPKYFSRNNTVALSVRNGSFVIETTRYEGWESFRALVEKVIDARFAVTQIDGVERLGLRYIDEIRVPDLADSSALGWSQWLHSTLLGPAELGESIGLEPHDWQGTSAFSAGDDCTIVLRYGAREGYAVDPGGDLKRPTPTPGPFFLLDIDSFWLPSGETPELSLEELMKLSDTLHRPVRKLFDRLIQDKLRNEVLRRVD